VSNNKLAVYEGAEGFGANTVGGRGGQVLHVTNLNDSGAGSLRWALEGVSGPRTVVFDVAGTITLRSQILVENPFVTIAGQTAPDEGITIEGSRIRLKGGETIVQGLKFRPGDGAVGMAAGDRDGLFIGTTDHTIKNVFVDHNSFTWGVDENVAINGHVKDITFSNNIVAEGLSRSIHPKGEHSKGLLISNWDSKVSDASSNISIVKNLFVSNNERNPEVRAGENVEIVNNLIYNPGRLDKVIAVGGGSGGSLETTVHVIGNVIDAGPTTINASKNPVNLSSMGAGSGVFISDNLLVDRPGVTSQASLVTNGGGGRFATDKAVFADSGIDVLDSRAVTAHVLANAGADAGARDRVDQRIVDTVRNGTGSLVNTSQNLRLDQAGITARAATDTDRDGMPDWFENRFGFDVRVADNNGDRDRDGYTNIEEYIQGLITGFRLAPVKLELTQQATSKADVFSFGQEIGSVGVTIRGFSVAGGDHLDLRALLPNFKPGSDRLADYVEVTEVRGSTIVSIDRDGLGTTHSHEFVAELVGVRDVSGVFAGIVPNGGVALLAELGRREGVGIIGDDASNRLSGTNLDNVMFGEGGDDHLFGRAGDDLLSGGAGNDWLEGGDGNDTMFGGAGNDTYVVDTPGDVISELAQNGQDAGGLDTVRTGIDFRLGDNFENLILTGSGNASGSGNALANALTGNVGDNMLFGAAGNDTLRGLDGRDMLNGGDGADRLEGGAGNDTLIGGAGSDTMAGGTGSDVFVFDRAPTTGEFDQIADYSALDDTLIFNRTGFAGLGGEQAGTIKAALFGYGVAATTADQRFIYDATRGNLIYDADGNGAGAAQLIARLNRPVGFSHEDIALA
jgi:Ca2+-binding RTX toxin-like protein